MRRYICLMITLPFLISYGCKREGRLDHLDQNLPAPVQVGDVKTLPTPGGAIVTYQIPKDPNLAYVEAVYEIRPGVSRLVKSPYYTDTLKLLGFGDTLMHDIMLYSVGKNEKRSAPIETSVKPLIPPVYSAFESLTMIPTFGGVQVEFANPSQAKLAIEVMMDTTGGGNWKNVFTFHTGAMDGVFSARGLDSTRARFGVFVRDRWNNKSDTLIKSLSPLFEEFIPKNTWSALVLPTDQVAVAKPIHALPALWDGSILKNSYATSHGSVLPQWFTIDLGEKVSISRILLHMYAGGFIYGGGTVKTAELYGSNHPDRDGTWDSWHLLGTFRSFKPSGLPDGQVSAEDIEYGQNHGEEFNFDHVLPAYRYIRWKTLETYANDGQVVIGEMDIYGQIEP